MSDQAQERAQEEVLPLAAGLRTGARWWAAADATAPLLLVLPALGTPASAYDRLGAALAAEGLNAGTIDLRGIGTSSVRASRNCDWGYADLVQVELGALLARARERHPRAPLWWLGHSLGGHLALLRAVHFPADAVAGIVLVASGTPHWRAFGGVTALASMVLGGIVPALTAVCGWYPGRRLGFGGNQPRSLMREWARLARSGELVSKARPEFALRPGLASLRVPVQPIHIEGDAYSPPVAISALIAGMATPAPLRTVGAEPGAAPLDHFRWLRQPGGVAREVAVFARRIATAGAPAA